MGRRKRFNVGLEKLHIWTELIWMVNWRTMVPKLVWRPIFETVYWWVMESRNESHKVLEMVLIYHYVLHAWHCICSLTETSSCSLSTLTVKLSETLWGSLAWKPFNSPVFWLLSLWPSLSSYEQIQMVANLGMERMNRQRRWRGSHRNNSAAFGQGSGSTSRDIHNIFKLSKMSAFFIPEKDHLRLH